MRHNEEYGAFRRRLEDSSDLDPDFDIAIRDQKRSYAEDHREKLKREILGEQMNHRTKFMIC